MAVNVPTLAQPDVRTAIEPADTSPNVAAVALQELGDVALEQNKKHQLNKAAQAFESITQEFHDTTIGEAAFELAPQSQELIQAFSGKQNDLANAVSTGQLTPAQAHTRAEVELKKMIARAPGLEDEFIAEARKAGLSPMGAGFRESQQYLEQARQAMSKEDTFLRNTTVTLLKQAGEFQAAAQVAGGALAPNDAMALHADSFTRLQRSVQSEQALNSQENSISLSENDAYIHVTNIASQDAATYEQNIISRLDPETQQQWIEYRSKGGTLSPQVAAKVVAAQVAADNDFNAKISNHTLKPEDLAKAIRGREAAKEIITSFVTQKQTAEAMAAAVKTMYLANKNNFLGTPEGMVTAQGLAFAEEFGIDSTVIDMFSEKAVIDFTNLVGGQGGIQSLRESDKELPSSAKTAEQLYLDVVQVMGEQPDIKPEMGQTATNFLSQIGEAIAGAPDVDTATRYMEVAATAAFLNHRDAADTPMSAEEAKQAYKQAAAEVGGNTIFNLVTPLREGVLSGEVQLSIEDGSLVLNQNQKDSRSIAASGEARRLRSLRTKIDRMAEAYAQFTGLDKEDFLRESLRSMVLNDTELQAQLGELAGIGAGGGRSQQAGVARQRAEIEQQIQNLQQQLSALGDVSGE